MAVGEPEIPFWAARVFRPGDAARVRAAIRKAESACSGEFVAVVVRESAGTAHAPLALGLTLLLVFYVCLLLAGAPEAAWRPLHVFALEASAAALLAALLSRVNAVKRFFTPAGDRERQAFRRARVEFYQHGLEKTAGRTGVLVFVSLMERRAHVLADKSIAAKVPPGVWQPVLELVTGGLKRGDLAGGLEEALALAASIVRPKFPRRRRDKNELLDHLIVKD